MIPISQVPFLAELKKIQSILRDDYKYDSISQNFYTSKEARDLFDSFSKRVSDYYDDFDNFKKNKKHRSKSKIVKLVKKYDFFIYDDFVDLPKFFKNEKKEGLEALVYSPFSVNFFCMSLKGVFNKYFIGTPIPKDEELNEITSQIGLNLLQNMKYCPPFLKQLFQEGYNDGKEKIGPTQLFEDYIIGNMFKNPYLFDILDFNQKNVADTADLNRLKNSIKNQFNIEGFFADEPLTVISHELKLPPKPSESPFSTIIIINFRDLLKQGKIIPDQISSELQNKDFIDQIQELVVTVSDRQQRRLFDNIKDQYNKSKTKTKRSKVTFQSFIEQGLKTIEFEIKLAEFSSLINQALFNLKCCLIVHEDRELQNIDYKVYINDPKRFCEEAANIYYNSSNGGMSPEDQLMLSNVLSNKSDPVFLMNVMLRGLTLDEFVLKRPGVQMANTSYYNEIEQYKNNEENRFEPLVKMKETNFAKFNRIASVYSAAFVTPNDPYNMLRGISKAYTFALNEMKMFMNPDVDDLDLINISDDDERKFISSLLYLAHVPNVYSTFIYLEEFLLAPEYRKSFLSGIKNHHFEMYDKLFPVMTHIGGKKSEEVFRSASQFCMIYNKEIDLVLRNNDDDLKRLAHIIACDNQVNEEIYANAFLDLKNNNIAGNSKDKFSFRVPSVKYIVVFVCNVTGFSNQRYDHLPLDEITSLEDFLNLKALKDSLEDD